MWRQKFHRLTAVPAVLMRHVQLELCLRFSRDLRGAAREQEAALSGLVWSLYGRRGWSHPRVPENRPISLIMEGRRGC